MQFSAALDAIPREKWITNMKEFPGIHITAMLAITVTLMVHPVEKNR
jgi:hypothetical protein